VRYYTADLHLGHRNIIKYCGRPFRDVLGMNEKLIRQINDLAGPDNVVYHVGDLALCEGVYLEGFLKRLKGQIVLFEGNHDKRGLKRLDREGRIPENITILKWELGTLGGRPLRIQHHPVPDWPPEAGYLIHGHVHGVGQRVPGCLDVGWDAHKRPLSEGEVLAHLTNHKETPCPSLSTAN
jgi:calcineurin-like phosphoesterase family protein